LSDKIDKSELSKLNEENEKNKISVSKKDAVIEKMQIDLEKSIQSRTSFES